MPPSAPCSTEKRPFRVEARSPIASRAAVRRSPVPLSATIVSISPCAVSRIATEIFDGGPRRTAWFSDSRTIW